MNLYRCILPLLLLSLPTLLHAEPPLPDAKPEDVGASGERLDRIDAVVKQALDRGDAPGAVVLMLHRGRIIFRRAYGLRSKQPAEIADDRRYRLRSGVAHQAAGDGVVDHAPGGAGQAAPVRSGRAAICRRSRPTARTRSPSSSCCCTPAA